MDAARPHEERDKTRHFPRLRRTANRNAAERGHKTLACSLIVDAVTGHFGMSVDFQELVEIRVGEGGSSPRKI
jgi:hypothetical protein